MKVAPHPEPAELKALLSDRLPNARQQEIEEHLCGCTDCQLALETLAGPGANLCSLKEACPSQDSAYWLAMKSLQSEVVTPPPTPMEPVTIVDPSVAPSGEHVSLTFLDPSEEPGVLGTIGEFRVVEIVGKGGMGVVLKALDVCLQRHVAIKVLDPQFAQNDIAQQRFCREARAAAAITHENVVAVHFVEHDEGKDLPYLVMQYVAGETLQDRLDREGPLPVSEILRIGMQTASGLAAAHAQGLMHRDIKPANILLEAGSGHVRLTDFGLARAAEDVKLTQTGFVAGTPLYMAPEQAHGNSIDHRTDLFSLGSVLYAMCTGNPPFSGSTPFVVLKSVTEESPKPVREINPAIPEWLEDVIEKLHAKKPEDRWQSAADLAIFFRQKLAELHAANPKTLTPTQPVRTLGQRRATTATFVWARVGQMLTAALLLLGICELAGFSHLVRRPGEASTEVPFSPQLVKTLNANVGPIWSTAFSPDGKTLIMGIDDGTIKVWDVVNGRLKATVHAHNGPIWSVAYTQTGDYFASSSDDGTAKIWDAATNKETASFPHHSAVRPLAFSPDGSRLVTGTRNGKILIWDIKKGGVAVETEGHPGIIMSIAWSRDGRTIASASGDKTVKLWDAVTGQEQVTLRGHSGGVYSVAISPDGKKVASGSWDRTVRIWDADNGNQIRQLPGHQADVWSVAFSPDGATVAAGGEDRTVRLWNVETGSDVATYRGHQGTIYALAFSADGSALASGGREGLLALWRVK
jgi:WD40 repeat protein